VLVVPGFAASDASTLALRSYLRWLGYAARGWGLGTNGGDLPALVPRVVRLLEGQAEQAGRRVRCVGWSLGGNLVREAARERPDLVERVLTLGTPAVGGPKYTSVGRRYRRRGVDLDEVEARMAARERVPIRVPVTAVYSRRDGIVAWQACIDRSTPDVEHVEVSATHLGLGFHPDVYRVVADRLAR
jgi:pimeloyl-ACP methyl ester carboxylesterase